MSDLFDLRDKTIVITGGGGVLCSAMALALAKAGARIAILDLGGWRRIYHAFPSRTNGSHLVGFSRRG